MLRLLLLPAIILLIKVSVAQTIATDFTANDCNGVSHHLFSELDAGKIIVISWVMPCASCIAPSRAAYDAVQNYTTSHPDKVLFYLADDYANTSCSSLQTWSTSNGMPNSVKFSNSVVANNMNAYGTAGMPKIVVLGGSGHNVYYNENNGANTNGIKPAIDQALAASDVQEENNNIESIALENSMSQVSKKLLFTLKNNSYVTIELLNALGQIISKPVSENFYAGEHKVDIQFSNMPNGLYLIRFSSGKKTKVLKCTISR